MPWCLILYVRYSLTDPIPIFSNTVTQPDDEDDWVFDTVKAPTMKLPKESEDIAPDEEDPYGYLDEPSQIMDDLHLSTPPVPPKHNVPSTVRRTPVAERSPSVRRANTKRRSSGMKQPLGVDLSFGNSPSTVRQFRRVSDKIPADVPYSPHYYPMAMDENVSPKTLFSEPTGKEAQLGRRAYSKAVGLTCQEILGTTADQDKRDAISRLAEAWSDLEMADPEGVYHIIRGINEKIQG